MDNMIAPPDEKKTELLQLRITPTEMGYLAAMAARRGRTIPDMVRYMIRRDAVRELLPEEPNE